MTPSNRHPEDTARRSPAASAPSLTTDAAAAATRGPTSPSAANAAPPRLVAVDSTRLADAIAGLVLMGRRTNREASDRFLDYAQSHRLPLDQCWAVLRDDGSLSPVCLAVPNPGRTALLFVTKPRGGRPGIELVAELIRFSHDHLDPRRIRLGQALLARHEQEALAAFLAAGYTHLADLAYLECRVARTAAASSTADFPPDCTIESFNNSNADAFKSALADSYVDTLDCPALCGRREIDDVFAGHRATGDFDPDLWTLVRRSGQPAAVLLLNPITEQAAVELTYIGVGASHRGQGLGAALLRHGHALVACRMERRITLAVDEANTPALRMYKSAGFYRVERRIALIRPVAPSSS